MPSWRSRSASTCSRASACSSSDRSPTAACRSKRRRSCGRSPRPPIAPARRSSRRSGATRRCWSRGSSTRRAIRSTSSPRGCPTRWLEHVEAGHAVLSIYANDPDQLKDAPPDLVGAPCSRRRRARVRPFRELISRNQTNWARRRRGRAVVGRARVPRRPPADAGVASVGGDRAAVPARSAGSGCRVGSASRGARRAHAIMLNAKQYTRCATPGPAPALTIGLPAGHLWVSGRSTSAVGDHVRAEPADRRSVHDAAQGSRRRHRAIDQAAQLRRHADRGLQPHASPTAASST